MRRHFLRLACAAAVAASSWGFSARYAQAEATPTADVLVIHATDCDKPFVDPEIGEAPPLKYKCYKLVERKKLPLTKGQASGATLPNGRTFQLTWTDTTADKRYKVSAAISQPDGKGFSPLANITAEPNKLFRLGGFAYGGGALVLAIRLVP